MKEIKKGVEVQNRFASLESEKQEDEAEDTIEVLLESRARWCVPPDETAMSKLLGGFDEESGGEECECCLSAGALSESYVKGVTRRKRLQRTWRRSPCRPLRRPMPTLWTP